MTYDMLVATPSASSIYTQFDSNGYDNLDSEFSGDVEYSSETGSLGIYWVADAKGPVYSQVSYADQYDAPLTPMVCVKPSGIYAAATHVNPA